MSTSKASGEDHVAVHGDKIKGVRIKCDGEIGVMGTTRYIAVEVALSDPVFGAEIATVSQALQLPLRMQKCLPHPAQKKDGVIGYYDNQAATFLMRCVDPALEEKWSLAPMSWQSCVGSVVVVRDDTKDITPHQVEAISYHSQHELSEQIEDASESGSEKERMKVAALFEPGKFREFFVRFKAEKVREDPSWDAAVCPV